MFQRVVRPLATAAKAQPDTRAPSSARRGDTAAPQPEVVKVAPAPRPARVQFKLQTSRPDDPLEREADRVAERIVAAPASPAAPLLRDDDAETVSRGALRPGAPAAAVDAGFDPGGGRPLDRASRSFFERRLGIDLGDVLVHTEARAAQAARGANAAAFTTGRHVVFGPGAYAPGTTAGRMLLAHELVHVVQQSRAAAPSGEVQRVPADPLVTSLEHKLNHVPRDLRGFYGALGGLNGSRAGDAAIRTALTGFLAAGKLSGAEAFRAVALQEIGPDRLWPTPVRNYAEGLDAGTFAIAGLAPAGADALRQFCIAQAGEAAEGADPIASYRREFDSRWDGAAYAALPTAFDNTLDSRGPRNRRARQIFADLYATLAVHMAYDTDVPAGYRAYCDTHEAPDGINNIASQRLQLLRAQLNPPAVVAANTADPAYTALVATITPLATALDARDHQEIERSHIWRLAVEAKVSGPTPADTKALGDALWGVITTARAAAPPGPPPGPLPPAPAAPPPEPVPAVNAAQHAWLGGITLTAPASPMTAQAADFPIPFQVRSAVPNPGLGVRRRVTVEPAAQVISGERDEQAWPNAAAAVDHTAHVNPDAGAAGSTTFTARLTMPPLPVATFPEKSAPVTVDDKRLDWFKATIDPGVTGMDENALHWVAPASAHNYFGDQFPITVRPQLGAPGAGLTANPNLTIFMDGSITRNGVAVAAMPRAQFGVSAASSPLFTTILRQPVPPPPAAGDAMVVTVNYYTGAAPAVVAKTQSLAFTLGGNAPVAAGGDAALIAADTAALNLPIATAGSLLNFMSAAPPGSPSRAVAAAVAAGTIGVAATIVRSDSAAKVVAGGGNPATQVAYAMGAVDPAGVFTHTLIAQSGAIGWRWSGIPGTVFLNLTPNTHAVANKRGNAEMAELLTHEGIHAADRVLPGDFDRYATEFRAYWIMGMGAGASEAPDPAMSNLGPKSPRANAIFRHLYGSATYPFVQPAYDGNVDHFRERVDNLLHPDGINLTLSRTLQDLRAELEGYVSSAAAYPAKKAAVTAKYALCTPDDRREISGNRAWRDLVEQKFTTGLIVVMAPVPRSERNEIKDILAIPQ